MPYASNAQRAYFHAAMARGDMSPKVVSEFDKASKGQHDLPEHVQHKAYGGVMSCPSCGHMWDGGEADCDDGDEDDYGGAVQPSPRGDNQGREDDKEGGFARMFVSAMRRR